MVPVLSVLVSNEEMDLRRFRSPRGSSLQELRTGVKGSELKNGDKAQVNAASFNEYFGYNSITLSVISVKATSWLIRKS